jgi:hypothetical protein
MLFFKGLKSRRVAGTLTPAKDFVGTWSQRDSFPPNPPFIFAQLLLLFRVKEYAIRSATFLVI